MLICIWISVSKNVIYVHACVSSEILKTQHLTTRVTQVHQNWNQGVMLVPVCFWLIHVFIPSLKSNIFFQSFGVLQENIISWVTIFLSTWKPLSCGLFSYYINMALDLLRLTEQEILWFYWTKSMTMFAKAHYWIVITTTGDRSLSLLHA